MYCGILGIYEFITSSREEYDSIVVEGKGGKRFVFTQI